MTPTAAQQRMALLAVELFPNCTSTAIARRSGMSRAVLSRRLPELERTGAVERVPRGTRSGWRLPEPQQEMQV